jgi:hypothetical protein
VLLKTVQALAESKKQFFKLKFEIKITEKGGVLS